MDVKAAQVVCRELGCGTMLALHGTSQSGAGTGPLWDLRFECSGTETLLSACSRQPPRSPGCTSQAGIVCSRVAEALRLVEGESRCDGRLEVTTSPGTWARVAGGPWDTGLGSVVCRQLGCGVLEKVSGVPGLGTVVLRCAGTEESLARCNVSGTAPTPTGSPEEVAVVCSGRAGAADAVSDAVYEELDYTPDPEYQEVPSGSGVAEALRLVEGESRCDGRLEVTTSPGTWARVAGGPWDTGLGSVVCRQLGCGVLEKVSGVPGLGTMALRCAGTEESLARCNVSGTAAVPTGSPEEVAVVCSGRAGAADAVSDAIYEELDYTPDPEYQEVPSGSGVAEALRLVEGESRCDGRLEVTRSPGTWARVAGGPWDTGLGSVVCRQLGCGVLEKVSGVPGLGTVVLRCASTEESLARCNVSGTAAAPTGSPEEVAVVCSDQLSLRLAGGSGRCAGRLEVLHNGTWGGVCANGTSPATAIAACRQLGCGDGGRLEPAPPGDTAPAWLAWVGCEKGTHWLWRCPSAPWRLQDCGPGGDVHVACDEDTDGTSGTPTPSPGRAGAADAISDAVYEELDYTPDPEYQEVPSGSGFARLVSGDTACAGRLKVRRGQTWASVCVEHVDIKAAQVVCRELGCGTVLAVHGTGQSGAGTGPLWDLRFECSGTETLLSACSRQPPRSPGCTSQAGIVCSRVAEALRLVEGESRCDGRLEVTTSPGTWARVAAGPWDTGLGSVVCQQLGCGVLEKVSGVPGLGTVVLRCAGTEESLARCNVSGTAAVPTGSPEEVAVVCSDQLSLRLAGGSGRCAGRLEVLHNGTWGGVCANGTSPATAIAACRQLGCGDGGRLEPAPPGDTAPAWLAWVGCEKGTHWLWRCPSAPWRLQDCGPGGDAHVACDEESDGTSGTPTPSPGRAGAADAVSDAIYEELDYTPDPNYQEVPSGSGVAEALRLVEGESRCDGRLEVTTSPGTWASVAGGPWDTGLGSVVCRQLGCGVLEKVSGVPGLGTVVLRCAGTEESLARCNVSGTAAAPTGSPEEVAVVCSGCAGAADAVSDAVYEELDYIPDPEYQEVPSGSGGSCQPSSPAEATGDPPAQPPGHTDYDDVGSSTLGTSL
ncbi:hypothetical protein Q9233_008948 [Columba guinea]|nr:hypothetical protein Q9233_008948 [Columba guinea]